MRQTTSQRAFFSGVKTYLKWSVEKIGLGRRPPTNFFGELG
jgi:hypothetical protein